MNNIMRFVPTCSQVDKLHNEAVRLQNLADEAFADYWEHQAPTVENWEHVRKLSELARVASDIWIKAFNAHYEAVDDWCFLPVKEGD